MLCEINPEKVFGDVLVRKQVFWDNINIHLKWRQIWPFAKRIVHDFGQKVEVFHLLCLSIIDREKVFADAVDKKEAFKDYKKNCLWKTQNKNFSKGVCPSFWSKIWDFFNFDF